MPLVQTATAPIWYADHRDPTAHMPTTIVVHGAGGTHLDWPAEIRRLPALNAVVIDLPGHGRSGGTGRATVPAYADDVIALMDALKIPRAIIVGHSMGGAIAQTLAIQYPQRVLGLVLVGTGAKLGVHPDILNGFLTEAAKAIGLIVSWYFGQSASDQMRRRTHEGLLEFNPTILYNDYAACNQFDVRAQLPQIQQPTLIIGGSEDKMTPFKFSEYLHQNIAHSQLVKVEGGGHMMAIEYPEFTAAAIDKWLAGQKWP